MSDPIPVPDCMERLSIAFDYACARGGYVPPTTVPGANGAPAAPDLLGLLCHESYLDWLFRALVGQHGEEARWAALPAASEVDAAHIVVWFLSQLPARPDHFGRVDIAIALMECAAEDDPWLLHRIGRDREDLRNERFGSWPSLEEAAIRMIDLAPDGARNLHGPGVANVACEYVYAQTRFDADSSLSRLIVRTLCLVGLEPLIQALILVAREQTAREWVPDDGRCVRVS